MYMSSTIGMTMHTRYKQLKSVLPVHAMGGCPFEVRKHECSTLSTDVYVSDRFGRGWTGNLRHIIMSGIVTVNAAIYTD